MDSTTPVTPALLPAQGRQRDGKRQSDPPPYRPRPGRTAGGNGARRPPPQPAPQHKNAVDPPRGVKPPQEQSRAPTTARPHPQRGPRQPTQWTGSRGRRSARPQTPQATVEGTPPGTPCRRPTTPSQVGGNRDRTTPPQARQTEHRTGAGHAEGHGPRGTALPAPSAGTTRDARATPPSGGGERTPRERERTHTKRTRGDYQKGNRTERAERTDRMEWRTSERG